MVTLVDFPSDNLFDSHTDESRQKDFSDSVGFQLFLVHLKSLSAMLWMIFLSGTNPPIRQKIPLDVSSCHFQRAPETLEEKAKSTGGMMVRFPAIGRLTVAGSAISEELRTNSPWLRVTSRGEVCIDPGATEDSSIGTSDSRQADSETGSGMDDKRVGVFCNGSTTVPEGNKGTKEGAMVS